MNMSYCRFTNTLSDLEECRDHFQEGGLSREEAIARRRLLQVCHDIVEMAENDDLYLDEQWQEGGEGPNGEDPYSDDTEE